MEKLKASQRVEEVLEENILSGKWEEGMKMPSEGALCGEYGVSRTSVREAMRELRGRGLIETINGSGSYVRGGQIDSLSEAFRVYSVLASGEKELRDLLEMRAAIEGESAAKLALSQDEVWLNIIKEAYAEMEECKDVSKYAILDIDFHIKLLETSGNGMFLLLGQAMKARYMAYLDQVFVSNKGIWSDTLADHKLILDGILSGDATRARSAVASHLLDARERVDV